MAAGNDNFVQRVPARSKRERETLRLLRLHHNRLALGLKPESGRLNAVLARGNAKLKRSGRVCACAPALVALSQHDIGAGHGCLRAGLYDRSANRPGLCLGVFGPESEKETRENNESAERGGMHKRSAVLVKMKMSSPSASGYPLGQAGARGLRRS